MTDAMTCKDLPLTRQIYSIYYNVKCNEDELPSNFPGRPFTDIYIPAYELELIQGRISEDSLHDLHILNSYLISKLGTKGQKSEKYLEAPQLLILKAIEGAIQDGNN